MYLENAAKFIGEHEINLTEEDVLDLLQIKYRWPEMAIEVINQMGNTSDGFFDSRKFLIYDRWKRLYDLGFTTLLNNVMDLTKELRALDKKLFEYKGSETNANLYFTAGTKDKRPSFDPHHHMPIIVAIRTETSRISLKFGVSLFGRRAPIVRFGEIHK